MDVPSVAAYGTLGAIVAKEVFAWLREIRHRAWEVEDRKALRAHVARVIDTSAALAEKVEQQVNTTDAKHDEVVGLVKETIEQARGAFHEANGAKDLIAEEIAARNKLQAALGLPSPNRRRAADPALVDLQQAMSDLQATVARLVDQKAQG